MNLVRMPFVSYWPVTLAAAIAVIAMIGAWIMLPSNREVARDLELSFLADKAVELRIDDVEKHPNEPTFLLALAESYVLAGDQATGLTTLDDYLSRWPGDLDVLQRAAELADWELEPDRAADYRMLVRAEDPANVEVRERLVDYLEWRQRPDEAIEIYGELADIAPHELDLTLSYGDLLSWNSRMDDSIEVFQDASERFPDEVEPLLRLGRVYRWTVNDSAALLAFEQAIEVDTDSLLAWTNLVELYEFVERDKDRAKALGEVARLSK